MGKLISVLFCCAMMIAVAVPLTFEQFLFNSSNPAQLKQLKGAKLVYKVTSRNEPPANLTIRTQRPGQLRIDVSSITKAYTVCQNGKQTWGYSKEDGIYQLSMDEIAELRYDAEFLPISINDSPAFSNPVAKGEESVDDVPCLCYESHSLIDPNVKLLLWVEKATNLLLKVEATDTEGKTVTLFTNYQDIQGVKVATLIYIADTTGYYEMRLQSATWNPVFAGQLFAKPANVNQVKIEASKTPETFSSAKQPRQVTTQQKIGSLKKKIAKLKVLVKNDEEKLARMEKLIRKDREQAASLASTDSNCNIWSRRGFFIQRRRAAVDINRRRMANKLSQEAEEAMKEYARLNRQLVRHRIQLSKAEVDLEMLNTK